MKRAAFLRIICVLLSVLVLAAAAFFLVKWKQNTIRVPQAEVATEEQQQEQGEAQPVEKYASVSIEPEVTLENEGDSLPIFSGDVDPELVTWTSADESIATVKNGVVTAVARGQVDVVAAYGKQEITCHVICDLPFPLVLNEGAKERDPVYLPPEEELVDDSFFADALFIGDSQGQAFYNSVRYAGMLKDAKHMARNSYSINSAAKDMMLLSWQGKSYKIEEAVEISEAKRVFIILGINDVGQFGIDVWEENWETVIHRIQERTPDVQICIQSVAPVWTGSEDNKINNQKVNEYNAVLEEIAKENGCVYIDIATYLKDSTGGMATCYSSDRYVHVNAAGVDTWVKVLKACTDY